MEVTYGTNEQGEQISITTLPSGSVVTQLVGTSAAALPPLTKIIVLQNITSTQWKAFATSTDQDVMLIFAKFQVAPDPMDRDDPEFANDLATLVSKGILSSAQDTQILTAT